MYRTNLRDVPKVEGLPRDDGWVDMQVQFLIDKKTAGADHVVGWTVLKPGARHENHRHHNCDEFFIVLKGHGHIYTDDGPEAVGRGRCDLFAARLLARLQQHVERRRRAGVGLDGRGLDRGLGLRGRSGEAQVNAWDDPRIARGMEKQLGQRRARIAAGEKPLGWKVGLGAPAAMERLKIKAPLVGFMMQKSLRAERQHRPVREAGTSPWPSRKSPCTWARTCPAAPTAPRPSRRLRRSAPRSNWPTSIRRRTTWRSRSPATSSIATSSSAHPIPRAPAPSSTVSSATCSGAARWRRSRTMSRR